MPFLLALECLACDLGKRDWTSKAIVDLEGNPLNEQVLNTVGISHSKPFRAARVELRFRVPAGTTALCAQIDGEEFPVSERVVIEVVPRAIVVKVSLPTGATARE